MKPLAACGHSEHWICPECARCTAHCCDCPGARAPVYIDSAEGASALRDARLRKTAPKEVR